MLITGQPDELAVITVATKPDAYFKVLVQSCKRCGIDLTVLGMGSPWRGFCTKLNLVYHHLTKVGSLPYTLFVDGFDCIFQSGLPAIWQTYLGFQSPLVVAADTLCWPEERLAGKFPLSPTKVRYLNSGCYLGTTKTLVRALEVMGCPFTNENQDDQARFSYYFLAHPHVVKLDYHSEISHTFYWAEDAIEFKEGEKAYFMRGSGKKPHILHLNGGVHKNTSYARNLGYSLV